MMHKSTDSITSDAEKRSQPTGAPNSNSSSGKPSLSVGCKFISILCAISLLVAAGCGSDQQTTEQPTPTSNDASRESTTRSSSGTTIAPASDSQTDHVQPDDQGDCQGERERQRGNLPPVFEAITTNDYNWLKAELESGSDPAEALNDGNTPLHKAAIRFNPDFVKLLLEAGADPNQRNAWCRTPLYYIVGSNSDENGSHPHCGGTPTRELADSTDHWEELRRTRRERTALILNAGADPNARDYRGVTPLMHYFRSPEPSFFSCVGKGWPNPQALDSELVRLLLTRGADIHSADINCRTPFSYSLPGSEVAEMLLEAGADPNGYNGNGVSLTVAIGMQGYTRLTDGPREDRLEKYRERINDLLAYGADPNRPFVCENDIGPPYWLERTVRSGDFPIHVAVKFYNADLDDPIWNGAVIKMLLDVGLDPNVKDGSGNTALDLAEDKDLRLLLIDAGAKPSS